MTLSLTYLQRIFPQENEFRNKNYGNNIPTHGGILESLETFTNEVNLRLSQEMD